MDKLNKALLPLLYIFGIGIFFSKSLVQSSLFIILVSVLVFLAKDYFLEKNKVNLSVGVDKWILIYALSICLSGLFSIHIEDPELRVKVVRWIRWLFLVYPLTYLLGFNYKKIPRIYKIMSLFCGIVAVYAIFQFFLGINLVKGFYPSGHNYSGFWRPIGLYNSTMFYSYTFGMFVFIPLSYLLLQIKKRESLNGLNLVITVITMLSLFFTMTRGLWLSIIPTFLFLFLLFILNKSWFKKVLLSLFLIIPIILLTKSDFGPINRLTEGLKISTVKNNGRVAIWQTHYKLFKENPITGVGFRLSPRYMQDTARRASIQLPKINVFHAHSNYLEVLSGSGVIGLLSYLALISAIFFLNLNLWKRVRESSLPTEYQSIVLGAIGVQMIFHLGGVTDSTILMYSAFFQFIFTICCVFAIRKKIIEDKV